MSASKFVVNDDLLNSCIFIADWPLSRVLLKNTNQYPWLILVPRRDKVTEIYQLSQIDRHALIDEISKLSEIMQLYFKPNKLNVGSLGNIVPQLHVHIIARFSNDTAWPYGVWQNKSQTDGVYESSSSTLQELIPLVESAFTSAV
ncbi:MAG: HIT domain-containing protein [Legionella sp.]|nr:HIT domain-containing protein [Legionella sp.]